MTNTNKLYAKFGLAISELTCDSVMNYGRALCLFVSKKIEKKPLIVIGRDTRNSSEILESALCAGICSAGGDCLKVGVLPYPAVSFLIRKHKADAGMMLCAGSASAEYNGIRLFSSSGFTLSESELEEIDKLSAVCFDELKKISVGNLGSQTFDSKAEWDYNRHIISAVDTNLHGVKIAVDCANGSASFTAKNIFEGLGAACTVINNVPNGTNINLGCGIANLNPLKQFVTENHYALGIAFDGDGERIAVVDDSGAVVDSDRLLTVFTAFYSEQNMLRDNTVVATVMTNLGFANFCKSKDINVISAKTGQWYVSEKMLSGKFSLGGDPNGHILFEDDMPISDAQLIGVKLLEVLVKTQKKLSELSSVMERCPQVILNIKISPQCREIWKNDKKLSEYIEKCSQELGNESRILVRECITQNEPVIRVLVEGRNFDDINKYALAISDKIKERVRPKKTGKKNITE